MLRAGTTTFEGKSGYGLDRDTELASLEAVAAAGGVPTWLGAHAVPPEFGDADAYLDFALAEVLPRAAELAEAADVFVEEGAFSVEQARRYLTACGEAGLALRLHGDQFNELGAVELAIELGARSIDHLEATGESGVRALAASDVTAVLLPASALFLDRPMPPAPSARRRRRRDRARHRLQPRQRLLREPAARLLAGLHAAPPLSGRGARRLHGQRGPRARARRPSRPNRGRPGRRSRAARRARLAAPRLPPRRRPDRDRDPPRGGRLGPLTRLRLPRCQRASSDAGARKTSGTNTSTSTSTARARRSRSIRPSSRLRARAATASGRPRRRRPRAAAGRRSARFSRRHGTACSSASLSSPRCSSSPSRR